MENLQHRKEGVFEGVTRYHWLVVIIASCGWLFDCMDQRLFVLSRSPALRELLASDADALEKLQTYAGWATAIFIVGWGTGGIVFGMMSDKMGRVKTMVLTLLIYSVFTGLSGLSRNWLDFMIFRFLTGLGVGGMFGAATALVAESVPKGFRALALGSLQALSASGNIIGSAISLKIQPGAENFIGDFSGWRILFFVGILPAFLVIPIVLFLKEPESWVRAKAEAKAGISHKKVGSLGDLFSHPRWRKNAIIGLCLGVSGMVGLWGIAFFSPELVDAALEGAPQKHVDKVRSIGTLLQDVGAFVGMVMFTFAASFWNRRGAFFVALLSCMLVTMYVFHSLETATDAYWMLPLLGAVQLACFAGYSIYFPELFPTRLRGTGVGFCYNTVRYLAAPAPILLGYLATLLQNFRLAAVLMSFIYLVGLVALIWAPETKDQPLPEDDPGPLPMPIDD